MKRKHSLVINVPDMLRMISAISILSAPIMVNTLATLGISGSMRTLIMMFLCYVTLGLLYLQRPYTISKSALFICVILLTLYYSTLILHPEYSESISDEMWTSIVSPYGGIVCIFAIYLFEEPEDLKKMLTIVSIFGFVYYGLQSLTAIRQGYWTVVENGIIKQQAYSMSFGYHMLLPTLVFAYRGLSEKKKIYFVLSMVGLFEILMLGSRMATVCGILFYVLYAFLISIGKIRSVKKRFLFLVTVIIAIGLFWIFYNDILTLLASVFKTIGFKSRTIERILEGTMSEDAARGILYLKSQELISSGGLFGHGFLADRYFLGSYCHNIFLELLIQFGYIGGILAIGLYMSVCIIMLFQCKNVEWKSLFLIFFTCSFFRLLVSYSLWIDNNFWIMLGIFNCYKRTLKEN